MSVIFMAGRKKKSEEIAKRDMSGRKKIIRKTGEFDESGQPKITCGWEVTIDGQAFRITFSRDNYHVWINSCAVGCEAYVTDFGYDVDIFFDIAGCKARISSDVDDSRNQMDNYLLIDGEIVGECQQKAKQGATKR